MRKRGLPLLLALVLLCPWSISWAQNLRIYHIDVEQGAATLFVSPGGKTLLVDSGKNGHGPRIKSVMDQAGVTRIDHFVNTHYHEDHYGGIDELARDLNVTIDAAYDRGDKQHLPPSKKQEATFLDYQNTVGQNATHLTRGNTISLDPAVSVICISSGGVVLAEDPHIHGGDENDMSVSLLIQHGRFRFFVGGDMHATTEKKIADRDMVLDVDVYQANHHGSHTSSSPLFMNDLKPTAIVISNGDRADYQHPRQVTLNSYGSLTSQPIVFQTNKYFKGGLGGNVPDDFIADLESSAAQTGTILISVDEPAGIYTVSYRDQAHTFQIKDRGEPSISASSVVIETLLPRPPGPDSQNETVTVKNKGSVAVSLSGWRLQDESGRIWSLTPTGTVNPGQSATIRRNGMPMSLNDDGDEIVLFNANNAEFDRFRYTSSVEGQVIQTGH
jgi:beta-lactamase superfamily II metal-dependent hydrolase